MSFWDVDHSRYGPGEQVEVTRFGQLVAANLAAAQQNIPAVTHHDRVDLSAIEALRKSPADEAKVLGVKLTTLAFHIKALLQAAEVIRSARDMAGWGIASNGPTIDLDALSAKKNETIAKLTGGLGLNRAGFAGGCFV